MKWMLLFVPLLLLPLTHRAESPVPVAHELVGTRWLAEDIRGGGVLDRAQSTLAFVDAGRVAGSGGCNRFGGGVTLDGETITFGPLMSTRMACVEAVMNQESNYLGALAEVVRYAFAHEGAILLLQDANGKTLVRLSRMDPGE
jgi:putative lipoprotein